MFTLQLLRGLGPLDARSIGRDSMLRGMALLPLVIALPIRFVLPIVLSQLGALFEADLGGFYPIVGTYALLLITPTVYGMVIGCLLLDQRDEQTLVALQVTPLPLSSYLAYRLAGPMLLGVLMTLIAFQVAGFNQIALPNLLLAACAAAPLASVLALTLGAFAENKVQGIALVKALSVLLVAPLAAHFVPQPWSLAFGVLPTYWPAQVLWGLSNGDALFWVYLVIGIAYYAVLLVFLARRFHKVIHQ
jgi:fluoroquinolone transport system permease protein